MKLRNCILALMLCFVMSGTCAARCVTTPDVPLAWQPNPEPDIAHYEVWRSNTIDGIYSKIADALAATYIDTLPAEGSYWFKLTAIDNCGNISDMSAPSEEVVFDPNAPIKPAW